MDFASELHVRVIDSNLFSSSVLYYLAVCISNVSVDFSRKLPQSSATRHIHYDRASSTKQNMSLISSLLKFGYAV